MDPENVRTIATTAGTVIVGVVPAVLLYLQNKDSAERAAEERREQRNEDAARREAESADHRADRMAAELREHREELSRFGVIVDKIVTELTTRAANRLGAYELSQNDLRELADAHSRMMLVDDEAIRDLTADLWQHLQDALIAVADHGPPLSSNHEAMLKLTLDNYWKGARRSVPAGHSRPAFRLKT